MGATGTTPSTDVGYISEDGVTIEVSSERRDIMQGNPKLIEYTFSQTQGVMVNFTSIEWDFENFAKMLGAGATTVSASASTLAFGGDPLVSGVAIHIEHQMAVTGQTMNVYVWKAVSEGGLSAPMGADEHSFEASFKAQRSATSWGGDALEYRQQLVKFVRDLA
tara:strand:+ start:129 stop:620 length:492 start_codon:yes stop_codon:yes gene_type:complete